MKKQILATFLIFQLGALNAQVLKLSEIMKGEAFVGYSPENHRWSLDGKKVYFEWNPNKEWGSNTYFWQNGMKMPQLAQPEEAYFSKLRFQKGWDPNLYYYLDKGAL